MGLRPGEPKEETEPTPLGSLEDFGRDGRAREPKATRLGLDVASFDDAIERNDHNCF